jgi:hypothetical protein
MSGKNYLLKHNGTVFDSHNKFAKNYESNFLEQIFVSEITDFRIGYSSTSNIIKEFEINNVSVTVFYNLRKFNKESEKLGNLRMIGVDDLIKKTEEDIITKGFDLEEIK